MWRELRRLSKEKPVVASMVDVAASGGYYLSMACDQIVAEVCGLLDFPSNTPHTSLLTGFLVYLGSNDHWQYRCSNSEV